MKFDFDKLRGLLRKRADDAAVIELIECEPAQINRSAHTGYVTFKDCGVSIVFKEAPWVVPEIAMTDSKELHLAAFHFHRQGYEGHGQYYGQFPNGIEFNDSEMEVIRKAGHPLASGGGGFSKMLKKPIPQWLEYSLGNETLHIQFDAEGKADLVTLHTPDLQKKQL